MLQSENKLFRKIGVIGSGAWGTALSIKCAENCPEVVLHCREPELEDCINHDRENKLYLPGIKLPSNIRATSELEELLACDMILLAIASQYIRSFLSENISFKPSQPVLLCSKGIEGDSLKCLTEVVREFWDVPVMVISGPNFAREVASGRIAAAVIAAYDINLAQKASDSMKSDSFILHTSEDVVGVQVLAAAKNVIAIAAGISDGLELGENCKAALITMGMKEACVLSRSLGGKEETTLGFAGIGDLFLTATSRTSRNMNFGYNVGKGMSLSQLTSGCNTIEGHHNCLSLSKLGRSKCIILPVIDTVYDILHNGAAPRILIDRVFNYIKPNTQHEISSTDITREQKLY